jgi:putative oxidoreductase
MEILVKIMGTDTDYVSSFIRLKAGIIIFSYGMQKLFGWFDDFFNYGRDCID